jgi:hypothetical protein
MARVAGAAAVIRTIHTVAEAETMYAQLVDSAAWTAARLRTFDGEPMALLKALRFETVGHEGASRCGGSVARIGISDFGKRRWRGVSVPRR